MDISSVLCLGVVAMLAILFMVNSAVQTARRQQLLMEEMLRRQSATYSYGTGIVWVFLVGMVMGLLLALWLLAQI